MHFAVGKFAEKTRQNGFASHHPFWISESLLELSGELREREKSVLK